MKIKASDIIDAVKTHLCNIASTKFIDKTFNSYILNHLADDFAVNLSHFLKMQEKEVEKLKAELLKVEAQRDLIICQGHCDSLTKELKQQLAEKDKVVQVLAEQVFKYAKWFGIKFEGGEVSEKYIIERATKQAEQ
jgi:Mg2+ and Co2+ transporter CorA